jgi:hypothetical protein
MTMKNIIKILKKRRKQQTKALVFINQMPPMYWIGLGKYANEYMQPAYNLLTDIEGLYEFCHYFLVEYSETNCETKKNAIRAVVFPIYESIAGMGYNEDLTAMGLNNPTA